MSTIRRICVYCGSGPGASPAFVAAARALGRILAENHIGLVYGGGSVGLMGELANAILDRGGEATGVIPTFLVNKEHAHGRGQIIETRDMHERKQRMFELADAFVALPGGIGTLEEVVEQMTWAQLGQHKKPILLDNAIKYNQSAPEILIRTRVDNKMLFISVSDNGIGIKEENHKKVFHKFYRVPTGNIHDVKGFGIGLNYVKLIVEKHEGKVLLKSNIDSGCTFTIEIPYIS